MGLEEVNPEGSGEQWIRPRAPIASEVYGIRSFFAEIEGLEPPPKEYLQELMPGFDESVLVRASPVRFEKALTGDNVLCCVHPYFSTKRSIASTRIRKRWCLTFCLVTQRERTIAGHHCKYLPAYCSCKGCEKMGSPLYYCTFNIAPSVPALPAKLRRLKILLMRMSLHQSK